MITQEQHYDVIVCGGGLAGTAAAISSARMGAKTLLIERYGFLGGAATNSLVNPFMSYMMADNTMVNSGIFGEIIRSLDEMGGLFYGNSATFNEELLKVLLDRMTRKAGVEVLFHSFIAQVEKEPFQSVVVANKNGLMRFHGSCFIDATGDADIAYFSGEETMEGNEDGFGQPMTLNFRLAEVDRTKFAPMFPGKNSDLKGVDAKKVTEDVIKKYRDLKAQGKMNNPREDVQSFPCMVDTMIHFNSTRVIKKSGTDVYDLSEAEQIAREQMVELHGFLKEHVDGFQNSVLTASGPQIGVRETRRIVGEYLITSEDLLSCKKFEDSIARGVYCIDVHNPSGEGTMIKEIPENDYYTIPFRAMLPKKQDHLIVCGRPISATHEAHSAIRVMPITTCMGQAAGIAAAIAAQKQISVKQVDYKEIQMEIEKQGGLY